MSQPACAAMPPPSETERCIAEYIASRETEDYTEILKQDGRWPVFYHLSPMRHSLLNWYPFRPGSSLLELGGEFGALTGLFCARCAQVTVVEPSAFRARALAHRHAQWDNLTLCVEDPAHFTCDKRFDYIVLVGTLETLFGGEQQPAPYRDYLRRLGRMLAPGGVLLIAGDNRLGLRHFCGAPDDHAPQAFAGVNRYPGGSSGYAFTHKELEDLVTQAGYGHCRFYYPEPDYKLPQVLYSQDCLPTGNIGDRVLPYFVDRSQLVAVESRLYRDVAENGAFGFLADSFLVECSADDALCDVVCAVISTDRGPACATATRIHADHHVSKTPLAPQGEANLRGAWEHIRDIAAHGIGVVPHRWAGDHIEMPYVEAPALMQHLEQTLRQDPQAFVQLMDRLYDCILRSSEPVAAEENRLPLPAGLDCGPVLRRAYLDMIPLNCFWLDGDFAFYDQEFMQPCYPAKYVLFRALLYFYNNTPCAQDLLPLAQLQQRYGLTELWEPFLAEEERFVSGNRNWDLYRHFYGWTMLDTDAIYHRFDRGSPPPVPCTPPPAKETASMEYTPSPKLRAVQDAEKKLLRFFQQICQENGLRYVAIYGTLLGAVRHQDIIPWDDDIDVAMPRADYDRLLALAPTLPAPYFLQTPENDPLCFYGGYAKLRDDSTTAIELRNWGRDCHQGIFIDILPLDNFLCDNRQRAAHFEQVLDVQKLLYAKVYGDLPHPEWFRMSPEEWDRCRAKARTQRHEDLCRRLRTLLRCAEADTSPYVGIRARYLTMDDYCFWPRNLFEQTEEVPFGDGTIVIPRDYRSCLYCTAGPNFMELPPPELCHPHHYAFVRTDVPYRTYLRRFGELFPGKEGKTLVAWGAESLFALYLEQHGEDHDPAFTVDNDTAKWGLLRHGHMVCPPQRLLELAPEQRHLIVCSSFLDTLEPQLAAMCIDDYRIYVQDPTTIITTAE